MYIITGASGMIGQHLKEAMPESLTPTHEELDLTNRDQVQDYFYHNKPEYIIHCGSNDEAICLEDNLKMFYNLSELDIPMTIFATGREREDRDNKNEQYVLSKYTTQTLALHAYGHISVIKIWGCFGHYERSIRFLMNNMLRVKQNLPITVIENKLFSYVYVKDLVEIIKIQISNKLNNRLSTKFLKVVGYTDTLLNYAKILKKITNSPHDIIVDKENFYHSYVGKDMTNFNFTPLETAIKEMWYVVNNNSK